jgi:hypothetical protein
MKSDGGRFSSWFSARAAADEEKMRAEASKPVEIPTAEEFAKSSTLAAFGAPGSSLGPIAGASSRALAGTLAGKAAGSPISSPAWTWAKTAYAEAGLGDLYKQIAREHAKDFAKPMPASAPAPPAPPDPIEPLREKIAAQAHSLAVLWQFIEEHGLMAEAVAFCDEQSASVST